MALNVLRVVAVEAGLYSFEDKVPDLDAALALITRKGLDVVCCEEDMDNPGYYDVFAGRGPVAEVFVFEPAGE